LEESGNFQSGHEEDTLIYKLLNGDKVTMAMYKFLYLFIVLLVCGTVTYSHSALSLSNPIRLRYASPYSTTHPFSLADRDWINYIQSHSHGRIQIEAFWGGSLMSADESVMELRHDVADVGYIAPIYAHAGMEINKVQTGFYEGIRTIEQQVLLLHCLRKRFPVFDKELRGVIPIALQGGNLAHVLTRNIPIHRLEDLQGLRIRTPVELVPVFEKLGIDAVLFPMGDVYTALSKGIIDGVVTAPDGLSAMHFAEVARYYSLLTIYRGAYPARAVSARIFSKLPSDLQALLINSGTYWESRIAHYVKASGDKGIKYARSNGVIITDIDPAEQKRFDKLYSDSAHDSAEKLSRFGINGSDIYHVARSLVPEITSGKLKECR
jgi:TRAP-type C4-dicarboxylate transport system substrate-binding protein